jgi:hypothetical protein
MHEHGLRKDADSSNSRGRYYQKIEVILLWCNSSRVEINSSICSRLNRHSIANKEARKEGKQQQHDSAGWPCDT